MKKHLIAAAVAAAVAVPAMAQVTVSGRIDTAFGRTSENANGDSATVVGTDVLTSNELVIAGSEDLGGGLRAFFRVASPFASDSNNTSAVDTGAVGVGSASVVTKLSNSGFNFGGRGMVVGLAGGFGSIEIGRTAGTMGNSTQASSVNGNIGNIGTLNARPNNSISYTTPTINGFTGRVLYSTDSAIDSSDATDIENDQSEISIQYSQGPLLVRAYSGKLDGGVTTGNDDTDRGFQVNYNFGVALVNVRYNDRETAGVDNKALGIGASIPLGNGLTLGVDTFKFNTDAANKDFRVSSVTLVKALSKRTNVYAAYAQTSNDDTASTGAFNSSTGFGGAADTGENATGFAIGVRHSF